MGLEVSDTEARLNTLASIEALVPRGQNIPFGHGPHVLDDVASEKGVAHKEQEERPAAIDTTPGGHALGVLAPLAQYDPNGQAKPAVNPDTGQ